MNNTLLKIQKKKKKNQTAYKKKEMKMKIEQKLINT